MVSPPLISDSRNLNLNVQITPVPRVEARPAFLDNTSAYVLSTSNERLASLNTKGTSPILKLKHDERQAHREPPPAERSTRRSLSYPGRYDRSPRDRTGRHRLDEFRGVARVAGWRGLIHILARTKFTTLITPWPGHIRVRTLMHRRLRPTAQLPSQCPTGRNDFEYLGQVAPVVCC